MGIVTKTGNLVIMSSEFHGDETSLTFHETPFFSLLAISAKLMMWYRI